MIILPANAGCIGCAINFGPTFDEEEGTQVATPLPLGQAVYENQPSEYVAQRWQIP